MIRAARMPEVGWRRELLEGKDAMTERPLAYREVAAVFLKLGTIAFGGPAAHIAMMRDEVVRRRRWLSDQDFLDLVGVTNLIPGPNSTEMAIYLGFLRAGWRGLLLAGTLFILPAAILTLGIAWAYARYGATPQADWILYGVKPVIIAVVVQALWGLGRVALKSALLGAVGLVVLILYLIGVNEIALLFGGGAAGLVVQAAQRRPWRALGSAAFLSALGLPGSAFGQPLMIAPASLTTLFLTFLKIGSVLYGTGYVLLAFLKNDFVERLGWLTTAQLLDAVAVGQFTPGPVFTTATFIGFLVGGLPGAILATIGIFLPAFVFVAAISPLVPRLRRSAWAALALDSLNAASLGLMAGVTWQLTRAALVDVPSAILAFASLILLAWLKVNSAWLIASGATIGILYHVLLR
jgi:chromate transporter